MASRPVPYSKIVEAAAAWRVAIKEGLLAVPAYPNQPGALGRAMAITNTTHGSRGAFITRLDTAVALGLEVPEWSPRDESWNIETRKRYEQYDEEYRKRQLPNQLTARGRRVKAAPSPVPAEVAQPSIDDLATKLVPLLRGKTGCTLDELAARLGVDLGVALEVLQHAKTNRAVALHYGSGRWHLDTAPPLGSQIVTNDAPALVSDDDGMIRFAAIGDTHLGSKYAREDCLSDFYDQVQHRGFKQVLHAGNWIDGEAPFNKHDLLVHGMDEQMRYLAKNYPQRDGVETWAITGADHEGWYARREGIDVGRYAENSFRQAGRTDWRDMGYMEAVIPLVHKRTGKSSQLMLMHPGGGSAYAISYAGQKIVEGFDGGEKPAVLILGHYHKASWNLVRNVHVIQTGCFRAATRVETIEGRKPISEVKVGDMVLTHKGRYRKVVELYRRDHADDFVAINYGRQGRFDQTVTATPEHPILVEGSDGTRGWVRFDEVSEGDTVFVVGTDCQHTGKRIPFWMKTDKSYNAMDRIEVRDKLSETKGPKQWPVRGSSPGDVHMSRDVLPWCYAQQAAGRLVVPVGAGVIPDAVVFEDGAAVAYEIEGHRGRLLAHKQEKYDGAAINDFIAGVQWVDIADRAGSRSTGIDYEPDTESPFVKVKVVGVRRFRDARKSTVPVYNLAVDEDNSYVAGHTVVHNCFEDQTVFMRQKKLAAHLAGCFVELWLDEETGAVVELGTKFRNYFVRSYYNGRFSEHGEVKNPGRGAL